MKTAVEMAMELKVSRRTIFRRIKAGELEVEYTKRMKSPTKEQTKERKRKNNNEWYRKLRANDGRMVARLEQGREYRRKVKVEVLTHYGNGTCACVRCSFDDIRALTIDHINGGGLAHLREIKHNSGVNFYYWLRKQGYPLGYQTLCFNCQNIKKIENKEWANQHIHKPTQALMPPIATTGGI